MIFLNLSKLWLVSALESEYPLVSTYKFCFVLPLQVLDRTGGTQSVWVYGTWIQIIFSVPGSGLSNLGAIRGRSSGARSLNGTLRNSRYLEERLDLYVFRSQSDLLGFV